MQNHSSGKTSSLPTHTSVVFDSPWRRRSSTVSWWARVSRGWSRACSWSSPAACWNRLRPCPPTDRPRCTSCTCTLPTHQIVLLRFIAFHAHSKSLLQSSNGQSSRQPAGKFSYEICNFLGIGEKVFCRLGRQLFLYREFDVFWDIYIIK